MRENCCRRYSADRTGIAGMCCQSEVGLFRFSDFILDTLRQSRYRLAAGTGDGYWGTDSVCKPHSAVGLVDACIRGKYSANRISKPHCKRKLSARCVGTSVTYKGLADLQPACITGIGYRTGHDIASNGTGVVSSPL